MQEDPIISQMLQHRPVMDDVPPDAEEERRRRMFVMLRWSNRYKKLQVEDANAKWVQDDDDDDDDDGQQQGTAQDPFSALESGPASLSSGSSNHEISQQSSCIQLDDLDLLDLEMASSSSSDAGDDDDTDEPELVEKTATGPIYAPETRRNSLDMKTCLKSAKTTTATSSSNPPSSSFKYLPPLQMRPIHTMNASNHHHHHHQQQFVPQQSYASLQADGSGYLTPPPEPPPPQQHVAITTGSVPSASSSPRRVSFSTEVRTFLLQAQLSNDSVHRMNSE
ncbi:hypothetical protein BJ741DRAFT_627197 [Chytriomyces cf. hyalinus JEL632]|nr:hypothetical protein BJ741DRAFT_627197 [Chytriomyces cf. hyalinus JEL632]